MSQIQGPFKLGEVPQNYVQEKGEKGSGYSDVSVEPAGPPSPSQHCNV